MSRPERSFRTDAVILRRQDFGEADRLLVLFTPGYGKLRAIAKGVRKPIARNTGHVELFSLVDMQIARGRELHILTQAETREPFLPLREDLLRGTYANHVVELLDRFGTELDSSPAEFDLLVNVLGWLTTASDPRLLARYYEIQLLGLVGFAPDLHYCVLSHEPLEPVDQFFSPADGGVIAPEHRPPDRGMPISLTALKTLRYMQTQSWEKVQSLKIGPMLHLELERLSLSYIIYILEQRLQSVDFLRRLRRESYEP